MIAAIFRQFLATLRPVFNMMLMSFQPMSFKTSSAHAEVIFSMLSQFNEHKIQSTNLHTGITIALSSVFT